MDKNILLFNGNILTLSEKLPRCEAVFLRNEKIVACGTSRDLLTHYQSANQVIDLHGKTVLPGFIDTHVHLTDTGIDTLGVDLSEAHSIAEIQDKLANFAKHLPPGTWVIGYGYDDSVLQEKRFPTRYDLDKNLADYPVCISRRDGHSLVVNSAGLKLLQLSPETDGYEKDTQTGEPTGIMRRVAVGQTNEKVFGQLSDEQRLKGLTTAVQFAISKGITTIHALEGGSETADKNLAVLMQYQDTLPVRIIIYHQTCDVARVQQEGFPRIGGCILVDGSIGSHTAAVTEPFNDDPGNTGVLYFTDEQLYRFIETAHCAGLQISMHAIGDRAIEQILKTYRQVLAKYPRADHRHRIEHYELPRPEQISQTAELGLILGMQPTFDYLWGGPNQLYATRLGVERSLFSNPFRTILDAGIKIAGGSDSYVTPMDPLLGIHSAVNHYSPQQRVTVDEAIRMYTTVAAYAAFEEHLKGTIEPGKLADLVVLEKNPYVVPTTELKDIPVSMTICRGEIVYSQDAR
ncbi:MAG: amidohydrolase [bacterium]|nr:amidohydrolase [bacterium]